MSNLRVVLVLGTWLLLSALTIAQISYPESPETDKNKVNLAGRRPLYSPSRCRKHELLYPGDNRDDWICDCAPANLYHPDTDACYPAFRRGPCNESQVLVLNRNEAIPVCVPNKCRIDGQVPIHNICYTLGQAPPCANAHLSFVLGVNASTLLLDCIKQSVGIKTRFGDDDTMPVYDFDNIELCARGTKRSIEGHCPKAQ